MHLLTALGIALQVAGASPVRVRSETPLGVIEAEIDSARAPSTAATFLAYVDGSEPTTVTGLRHVDGTLSMARAGANTATSSFFICIGDQPALDFGGHRNADGQGFAAFGRVTRGMDIVRKIQASPAEAQRLTPPVSISRIVRVR